MAEGYLVKRLKEKGLKDIEVISAGTYAIDGRKPTKEAIRVMADHGVNISEYISSALKKEQIGTSDIILVMERYHKETILNLVPDAEKKIYYLRGFSSERNLKTRSISDPIAKPEVFYREVFDIIKDCTEGFLVWLKE